MRGLMTRRVLLAGALITVAVLPAQCWGLTIFQTHFNGSLETAEGQQPTAAEGIQFVRGRCGTQGLMVTGETTLQYPAMGNISLYQGTYYIWVKPVGWRGGPDDNVRDILYWRQKKTNKQNFLGLVQNARNTVNVLLRADQGPYLQAMTRPANVFQDGKWVQIAAAWSVFTGVLQLYINGQLVDEVRAAEPLVIGPTGETFLIGGRSAYPLDSVIDEVVISDQCHSRQQIMAELRKPIAAYSD